MILHTHADYDIHFYGKEFSLDELHKQFPGASFMKQVHGDQLVEANAEIQLADAQWTATSQRPLVVQTADCLPIMIYLPLRNAVIGLHAGWRGVEQKIVTKSLRDMAIDKDDPIHIYVGPHIQKDSFEVDADVANGIMKAHGLDITNPICEKRENKFHIDLSALIVREIKDLQLNIDVLFISEVDTKTHPEFYSYRDGDRGGRNYSIIRKK